MAARSLLRSPAWRSWLDRPCRSRRSGWYRRRSSAPHVFLDGALSGEGTLHLRVIDPGAGKVAQIAVADRGIREPERNAQDLDRDLVEAARLPLSPIAQSAVDLARYV